MQNKVSYSIPVLVTMAEKATIGAGLYGAALPLLQNTSTTINADIVALTDAIMAHGTGKDLLAARRQTLDTKVETCRGFLSLGRDTLKPDLGSDYTQSWDSTGFVGSLAIPRSADDVLPLLNRFKQFLVTHPTLELPPKITATQAQDLWDQLKAAIGEVMDQEGIVDNLIDDRDAKAGALRKRMSDLIAELKMRMPGLDGRWKSFGLNPPDSLETPEAPEHVSAILIGPNAAAVKWNAAERAEYYRVFKKVQGVDNDYVAAGSPADLDFALENLPANSTIDIVVTAVNNGGESPVSEKITIVTH